MKFRVVCPSYQDVEEEGEYNRQAIYKAARKLGLVKGTSEYAKYISWASALKVDSQRVGSGKTKIRW